MKVGSVGRRREGCTEMVGGSSEVLFLFLWRLVASTHGGWSCYGGF